MKYFLSLIIVFIGLGSLSAQSFISKLQTPLLLKPFKTNLQLSVDTLKILAVMAEFQVDRDGTTFGNGTFGSIYSSDYGQNILDPLPHDRPYFLSHLEFAKNYFKKVSNGKLVIQYTVLPNVYTVTKTMRNYSPPSNSSDFTLLANFAKEAWKLVDSLNPGFDFSQYNVFTIFHAGAGRDVTLPGTLGNEHNLPSIYMSDKLLKEIYGNSFSGFSVQNNTFNITNTIIMPETESREVSNGLTKSFFQLTINGLLAANIGSAIGLPDLFNTKTGESAIGRFGLMDGQAFFGYQGTFPPEPSPWAKIYLGWAESKTIQPGNYNINLVANLAASLADTVILRVPINSKEYFLIENRNRDANKDGAKITFLSDGQYFTKTFAADIDSFSNIDVSAVRGVVTDVDEYDWALPGSGILIWHIDENIIDNNLASNSINADKDNRGVSVVEADGIKDIGEKFYTIFGDEVIGEGTQDDFWYKSNPSEFYKNVFDKDTRPNSNANTGANSLIKISGFSEIGDTMSFNVAYGDSIIKPIFVKEISSSALITKLISLTVGTDFEVGTISNKELNVLDKDGDIIFTKNNFSEFKPATIFETPYTYYFGVSSSDINIYVKSNLGIQFNTKITAPAKITTSPAILSASPGQYKLLLGAENGKIYTYLIPNPPVGLPQLFDSTNVTTGAINKIALNDTYFAVISGKKFIDSNSKTLSFGEDLQNLVLTKNSTGDYLSVVATTDNIYVINNGEIVYTQSVGKNFSNNNYGFIITDLKQNGQNYIVYNDGLNLVAKNISGASADNFSFIDPLRLGFTGTPLAIDFASDSKSEIIAATVDGRIYAIDGGSGTVLDGFPLKVGTSLNTTPVLFENNGKVSLAAVSDSNIVYSWTIGAGGGNYFWSSENGNNFNSSFVPAASRANYVNEFFPKNRAYNYPNPVYGNSTKIHYYVSQDSKINIKIFDIAGSFVDELNDFAQGGMDHETTWNVGNIQSGIYIARIEASGAGGKIESNIIKIAVVK
ncbi:MAG TPA: T9SS type A sorting domain-containing protein [Ignavibacteriaceae bacterium]|nr:T9SS type A sorting domain-containing protein [Ignavibacteriaceae bacterium]